MISTDPFSPVSCEIWPPWIRLVCSPNHTDVTWKSKSAMMAGLKVSYQDIAQSTTHCLLQVTFYPIVHTGARCFPGKQWTKPRRPHDVKEHVIDQTRPLSSIASWSTSDAHMAIVGAFCLPHTQHTAMHCLSEPAWNLMAVWATVVCLLHRTTRDDDHSNH